MSEEYRDAHNDILQSLSESAFASMDVDPDADTKAAFRAHLGIGAPGSVPAEATTAQATNSGKWVSIAEAARQLNVSDKTIRRRIEAGEIKSDLENLPRGGQRRIVLLPEHGQNAPDTSGTPRRTIEAGGTAERDTSTVNSETIETIEPVTVDTVQSVAPDTGGTTEAPMSTRLIESQASEIVFLRGQIEQQQTAHRLQIEQHQRAEAELRAALREALKMSSRALPAASDAQEVRGDSGLHVAQDAQHSAQMTEPDKVAPTSFGAPESQPAAAGQPESSQPVQTLSGAQIGQGSAPEPAPWYPEKQKRGSWWRWLIGG